MLAFKNGNVKVATDINIIYITRNLFIYCGWLV